jgi:hypothetical protein
MPLPIRPVVETQEGSLHKTYSDPFAFVPISDLQKQIMEEAAAPYNEKPLQREARSYKTIDKNSRKQLFDIWTSREPEIIQAQTSLNMEPSFKIPKSMTSSEVMRLVAEGLISRQDGSRISFTKLGKQALNKEVMDQPNSFMSQKTRSKALKIAQTLDNSTEQITNGLNLTQAQIEQLKTLMTQDSQAYEQFMQEVPAALEDMSTAVKELPIPTAASNMSPRMKVEAAIIDKITACDTIYDAVRIQKLSNILNKLDSGYLTQDEVDLVLE